MTTRVAGKVKLFRIVEKRIQRLVGRYCEDSGSTYVSPDNARITQEVLVTNTDHAATAGQFVCVEIIDYPTHRSLPSGRIVEVLGDFMAPGMEIDIAIRNYEIPHVWPAEVEREAARLDPEVTEADKVGRVDLRNLPLVTIDGEDARDFDDAVYCEKRRGGYRLVVAIADVSHYVRKGTGAGYGSVESWQFRVFPAASGAHVAGGVVQRAMLAKSACRSLVYGLRHEYLVGGACNGLPVL
jgi:ribonuclease R